MVKKKIIAIAYDGVINDHGNLMAGARHALETLHDRGYRIVIHTTRARNLTGKSRVMEWLDKYDLPYSEITAVKPDAVAYIDAKGIYFTNWLDVLKEIDLRDPLTMLE